MAKFENDLDLKKARSNALRVKKAFDDRLSADPAVLKIISQLEKNKNIPKKKSINLSLISGWRFQKSGSTAARIKNKPYKTPKAKLPQCTTKENLLSMFITCN